jgi:acyl-CoA synthetase (AMP-forming)/AMP-acid ligase II
MSGAPFEPSPDLPLDEVLRANAARDPEGAALVYAREPRVGEVRTWRELDGLADAFAARLVERGVAPGDRVAIVLVDSPECLGAIYGIFRAGAVVVPIDTAWGATSIKATLAHSTPKRVAAASLEALAECGLGEYEGRFDAFTDVPPSPRVESRSEVGAIAMLAFTSGTTSRPKGVVIRHKHFRAAYRAGASLLGLRGTKRFGCMFRLSGLGILGMNYFFAHEVGAATVVLPEFSLATVKPFWERAYALGVEYVYLVPAVIQIMNKVALAPPADRGGARKPILCVTAAAPITRQAHAEFQERFGAPLRNAYGLTEASFAVFFGKMNVDGTASRSIGKALGVEARLLDADGRVIDGPGTGELEIRGPMVTDGYWNDAEATAKIFHDGWLRSGDVAERDEDGNFQICGRVKDVVIRGGFNIHLAEVEEALLAHPQVAGACAVGVSDALTGEELYAVVQLAPGAGDLHAIERWARERLGQSRAPRRIFASSELPRNGAGKIVRALVASEVGAKLKSSSPSPGARAPASSR